MARTRLKKRVMHRPSDLLELVADVERYPHFITPISALRVNGRKQTSDSVEEFEAEATISYKFISERFQSHVTVDRANNTVTVKKSGHGGAVRHLDNRWELHELSDGSTLVDFYVRVKLKAFPLEMLLSEKFDKAGRGIMKLFEHKAGLAYETVGDPDLDWEKELNNLA